MTARRADRAPQPGNDADNCTARHTQQKRGCHFATEGCSKPAPRDVNRAQRVDRHAHRLHADAFVQSEHHRQKERHHQTMRERRFEKPGQNRR